MSVGILSAVNWRQGKKQVYVVTTLGGGVFQIHQLSGQNFASVPSFEELSSDQAGRVCVEFEPARIGPAVKRFQVDGGGALGTAKTAFRRPQFTGAQAARTLLEGVARLEADSGRTAALARLSHAAVLIAREVEADPAIADGHEKYALAAAILSATAENEPERVTARLDTMWDQVPDRVDGTAGHSVGLELRRWLERAGALDSESDTPGVALLTTACESCSYSGYVFFHDASRRYATLMGRQDGSYATYRLDAADYDGDLAELMDEHVRFEPAGVRVKRGSVAPDPTESWTLADAAVALLEQSHYPRREQGIAAFGYLRMRATEVDAAIAEHFAGRWELLTAVAVLAGRDAAAAREHFRSSAPRRDCPDCLRMLDQVLREKHVREMMPRTASELEWLTGAQADAWITRMDVESETSNETYAYIGNDEHGSPRFARVTASARVDLRDLGLSEGEQFSALLMESGLDPYPKILHARPSIDPEPDVAPARLGVGLLESASTVNGSEAADFLRACRGAGDLVAHALRDDSTFDRFRQHAWLAAASSATAPEWDYILKEAADRWNGSGGRERLITREAPLLQGALSSALLRLEDARFEAIAAELERGRGVLEALVVHVPNLIAQERADKPVAVSWGDRDESPRAWLLEVDPRILEGASLRAGDWVTITSREPDQSNSTQSSATLLRTRAAPAFDAEEAVRALVDDLRSHDATRRLVAAHTLARMRGMASRLESNVTALLTPEQLFAVFALWNKETFWRAFQLIEEAPFAPTFENPASPQADLSLNAMGWASSVSPPRFSRMADAVRRAWFEQGTCTQRMALAGWNGHRGWLIRSDDAAGLCLPISGVRDGLRDHAILGGSLALIDVEWPCALPIDSAISAGVFAIPSVCPAEGEDGAAAVHAMLSILERESSDFATELARAFITEALLPGAIVLRHNEDLSLETYGEVMRVALAGLAGVAAAAPHDAAVILNEAIQYPGGLREADADYVSFCAGELLDPEGLQAIHASQLMVGLTSEDSHERLTCALALRALTPSRAHIAALWVMKNRLGSDWLFKRPKLPASVLAAIWGDPSDFRQFVARLETDPQDAIRYADTVAQRCVRSTSTEASTRVLTSAVRLLGMAQLRMSGKLDLIDMSVAIAADSPAMFAVPALNSAVNALYWAIDSVGRSFDRRMVRADRVAQSIRGLVNATGGSSRLVWVAAKAAAATSDEMANAATAFLRSNGVAKDHPSWLLVQRPVDVEESRTRVLGLEPTTLDTGTRFVSATMASMLRDSRDSELISWLARRHSALKSRIALQNECLRAILLVGGDDAAAFAADVLADPACSPRSVTTIARNFRGLAATPQGRRVFQGLIRLLDDNTKYAIESLRSWTAWVEAKPAALPYFEEIVGAFETLIKNEHTARAAINALQACGFSDAVDPVVLKLGDLGQLEETTQLELLRSLRDKRVRDGLTADQATEYRLVIAPSLDTANPELAEEYFRFITKDLLEIEAAGDEEFERLPKAVLRALSPLVFGKLNKDVWTSQVAQRVAEAFGRRRLADVRDAIACFLRELAEEGGPRAAVGYYGLFRIRFFLTHPVGLAELGNAVGSMLAGGPPERDLAYEILDSMDELVGSRSVSTELSALLGRGDPVALKICTGRYDIKLADSSESTPGAALLRLLMSASHFDHGEYPPSDTLTVFASDLRATPIANHFEDDADRTRLRKLSREVLEVFCSKAAVRCGADLCAPLGAPRSASADNVTVDASTEAYWDDYWRHVAEPSNLDFFSGLFDPLPAWLADDVDDPADTESIATAGFLGTAIGLFASPMAYSPPELTERLTEVLEFSRTEAASAAAIASRIVGCAMIPVPRVTDPLPFLDGIDAVRSRRDLGKYALAVGAAWDEALPLATFCKETATELYRIRRSRAARNLKAYAHTVKNTDGLERIRDEIERLVVATRVFLGPATVGVLPAFGPRLRGAVRSICERVHVRPEIDVKDSAWDLSVAIDWSRFMIMLDNLITNAARASLSRGYDAVGVTAAVADGGLQVTVSDRGDGFGPLLENVNLLFDRVGANQRQTADDPNRWDVSRDATDRRPRIGLLLLAECAADNGGRLHASDIRGEADSNRNGAIVTYTQPLPDGEPECDN